MSAGPGGNINELRPFCSNGCTVEKYLRYCTLPTNYCNCVFRESCFFLNVISLFRTNPVIYSICDTSFQTVLHQIINTISLYCAKNIASKNIFWNIHENAENRRCFIISNVVIATASYTRDVLLKREKEI